MQRNIDEKNLKFQGWMWKRGHLRKNWKKRWFILAEELLAYFESPMKAGVR
jgi:flavodoxin